MSRKRVLLGLSIIAGGVCASLPFRLDRSTPPHDNPTTPVGELSPLLSQPLTTAANQAAAASHPSPYLDDGTSRLDPRESLAPSAILAEEVPAEPRSAVQTPPMLPVSFQVKESGAPGAGTWLPKPLEEGPAGPPREYLIRKHDTLEDLAERFLGSRDRAEELFEFNRGVLKNRQILPLGAAIRIPAGGSAPTAIPGGSDLQPVRPEP